MTETSVLESEETGVSTQVLPESNRGVDLKWLDRYAHVMDNLFRLPGTQFRFGLDPILGFIPVVGSLVGFVCSGILACYIIKYGASGKVVAKMMGNMILDLTVGSIPVVGFVFDFLYKSNDRNMRMMREHYFEDKHNGSALGPILIFVAVSLSIIVAMALFLIAVLTAIGVWLHGFFQMAT